MGRLPDRTNHQHRSKKKLWGISIIVVILSLGGVILFLYDLQGRKPAMSKSEEAVIKETAKKRMFTLYFPSDSKVLLPEYRETVEGSGLIEDIKIVVAGLIEGPKSGLKPALPPQTRLMGVWIDADGVCYLNFSKEIQKVSGGALEEMLTVGAIVETISTNFPQIKGIRILIDGADAETLSGHIDISNPLTSKRDVRSERDITYRYF